MTNRDKQGIVPNRHSTLLMALIFVGVGVGVGVFSSSFIPTFAATDMATASYLYRSGRYTQAKKAFIELISQHPNYCLAHYKLANTYLKLKDYSAAEKEYKWSLKFCKNQNIRKNCLRAITRITKNLATVPITQKDTLTEKKQKDAFNRKKLDAKLARLGQQRVAEEQAQAKAKQAQILARGEARAQEILESITSRIEQANLNSDTWYYTPGRARAGYITRAEYDAIIEEANRQAQDCREQAKAEAEKIEIPGDDHATDGLRSQLVAPASHSKVKLAPHGTSIYIRNYKQSVGAKKIPAAQ